MRTAIAWMFSLLACSGATINVGSYGDGSSALSNFVAAYTAASDGDTISFPGGSATWTNSATVSKPLAIVGNSTTINAGATLNNGVFYVTGMTSAIPVRITGFTFNLSNFTASGKAINVYDNVDLSKLMIDNCTFHFGYEQIQVAGSKGVIFGNTFRNSRKAISFTAGSTNQAHQAWADMSAGTSDALFVEDNTFVDDANYPDTGGQEKIGTFNGGKLVIRNNEFDFDSVSNLVGTATTVLTHGSAAGGVANGYWQIGTGGRRGQSVVEIYRNDMHGIRIDFLCALRGSANLVWSNTLSTTAYNPRVNLYEEEQYEPQWSPNRTNWPAEDQVHNSFFWGNTLTLNGATNASYVEVAASSTNFIQLNRDYFLHAPEASGGKEIFTGLNGASGSYPTDGSTYPTLGTMQFVADSANAYYPYTPYQYPHPLRGTTATAGTVNVGTLIIAP